MATLLIACGGTPQKEAPEPVSPATETTPDLKGLTMPASLYRNEFQAAEAALARNQWMVAETSLTPLAETTLDANDSARLTYTEARIAHLRGDDPGAQALLKAMDQPGLHPAIAYRAHNFQRHLLDLQRDYLTSAALGAQLLAIAPSSDQLALKRSVWHDLMRTPPANIARARGTSTDQQWAAWLELAELANQDSTHLATGLPAWQANNPGHPANSPLPGGLQYLQDQTAAPHQVALMLPLSGRLAPAGKAVRDGYLASYFKARQGNAAPFEIRVVDSDLYPSVTEAYRAAINGGARMVVGPLSKNAVAELALEPGRPVPILALNQMDGSLPAGNSALIQFALAPEDEAAQIAEVAFGDGARRALLLRPAGAWGDKMEQALRARWQTLGGTFSSALAYTGQDDYSASIKNGLGIASSEARRRQLRDMLAEPVEFTPRRRQDIDAIFLLARNAAEARSMKPLLAFHYAGALPVYATSSVYRGSADDRDRDLNGLNLVELPWLLGSNRELSEALAKASIDAYPRLNALGADAYLLQSRFLQLQAGPDLLIRGDTGLLSLNPQLQIERELVPAKFDGGELAPR
ncbi:penicillin-binding protein activator [Halioglobus maricola]|uniref:penicillin-binding protein activator n=1 Tax=Halioglobus maricola TaxID=2601894 RepID=UPI00197AC7C5|nr:penicillin-binding protein activator [Halioglobus maricola]